MVTIYHHVAIERLHHPYRHRWEELVNQISRLPISDPRMMALTLTVRRLRRAVHLSGSGCYDPLCAVCVAEAVANFDGTEEELLNLYHSHLDEIISTLTSLRTQRRSPAVCPITV